MVAGGQKRKTDRASSKAPSKADAAVSHPATQAREQRQPVPKPKPVPEQQKSRRKKKQASNADDLDKVISNRAAALFGSKSLQLDSKWFD